MATLAEDELQCAFSVMSCVLPSLKVPVAVSLTEVPLAINGFAGTIEIETRCAVETVSPVNPLLLRK